MIAYTSISRLQSMVYIVQVNDQETGATYSSIAEAIADSADIPPAYAKFANIEYHRIRLATLPIAEMQPRSQELGADLVRMCVECSFWEVVCPSASRKK